MTENHCSGDLLEQLEVSLNGGGKMSEENSSEDLLVPCEILVTCMNHKSECKCIAEENTNSFKINEIHEHNVVTQRTILDACGNDKRVDSKGKADICLKENDLDRLSCIGETISYSRLTPTSGKSQTEKAILDHAEVLGFCGDLNSKPSVERNCNDHNVCFSPIHVRNKRDCNSVEMDAENYNANLTDSHTEVSFCVKEIVSNKTLLDSHYISTPDAELHFNTTDFESHSVITQESLPNVTKLVRSQQKSVDGNIVSDMNQCIVAENESISGNIKDFNGRNNDVYDIDADDEHETLTDDSLRALQATKKRRIDIEGKNYDSITISKIFSNKSDCSDNMKTVLTETKVCVPNKQIEQTDRHKVVYIYSKELVETCDQMQKIPLRASMIHSLIEAYRLTRYMRIVEPRAATDEEVLMFHNSDYVNFLKKISCHDDIEKFEEEATQYGLSYDCPLHQGLYKYATVTSGATLVAAECILEQTCRVAINWCGGWHHAAKDHASGFCYINDIVLGILKLRQKYNRILYVDLDLHHGDGVEDAFSATSKVFTVSFHKFVPGFFPGTGSLKDVGIGKGQYYTVNVPLLDGIRDVEFTPLVCRVLDKIKETYRPEVVVCQCGADGLAGDPMESFNLTHKGLGKCLYFILQWNLPTLILGGGGYNLSNTARCWTFLTGLAAGKQLPTEIPDHRFFMEYGPDFDLEVHAGNRKNDNTAPYLKQVYGMVMSNIGKISDP